MFRKYFKLIIYLLLICAYVNCQQQQETQSVYSNDQNGQHASIVQPTMSNNNYYQNRQAGFASTTGGIVNFLPIAFVAGFGLLLLIPILLLFFSTGFGPGFGYAGYASRKRSIDDIFEPMFNNLMLMNLAKNPVLIDFLKRADKEGLISKLQPLVMDIMNGKGMKTEQFKTNVHNFLNPIIKDVLPTEWRRTAVQIASKFMKSMTDHNLNKNEYLHKNKLDNKANINIVNVDNDDTMPKKQ